MKNLKLYIVTLLLTILITPSIALASWWNPFTWNWSLFNIFSKSEKVEQTENKINDKKTEDVTNSKVEPVKFGRTRENTTTKISTSTETSETMSGVEDRDLQSHKKNSYFESRYGYKFYHDDLSELEIKSSEIGKELFYDGVVEKITLQDSTSLSIDRKYCNEEKNSLEKEKFFKAGLLNKGTIDGVEYYLYNNGCYECYDASEEWLSLESLSFYACSDNGEICLIARSVRGKDIEKIKDDFLSKVVEKIEFNSKFKNFKCLVNTTKG